MTGSSDEVVGLKPCPLQRAQSVARMLHAKPCKRYVPPPAEASARWRLEQCRKTVREGVEELERRREALRQAEIALAEVTAATAVQTPPDSIGERHG